MASNLRPIPATHPYMGGPRGTIRLMPGPRCARARGGWLEEALEPTDGGGGGCALRYEAAKETAYRDWSQPAGGGANIPILFRGDEAPPKNPRAHGRRNTPLKGITYESHDCKSSPSWYESGADIQGINGSGMSSPPCIQLERPHAVLVAPSCVVGC